MGLCLSNTFISFLGDDCMQDIRVGLKAYSMGRKAQFAMSRNGTKEATTTTSTSDADMTQSCQPKLSEDALKCSSCTNTCCLESCTDTIENSAPECCDERCMAEISNTEDCEYDINGNLTKFDRFKKHGAKQEKWLLSKLRKNRQKRDESPQHGTATTRLIARFAPKGTAMPIHDSRYVEIDFSYSKNTNADVFKTKGYLESLLPVAGDDSTESLVDERIYVPAVDIFFQNFPYFVNNLEGIIWWNGFNVSASGNSETRLKLVDFDFEPSQVVISLDGIKDLHLLRSAITLELRAKDVNGNLKWFRIKGRDVASLKATGPNDGVVKIEFPEYSA